LAKRRIDFTPDSTGQYFRQIGYLPGSKSQPKFRLGRERVRARLAYDRLGVLWETIVQEHKKSIERENWRLQLGRPPQQTPEPKPCWTDESLAIAEAIRTHLHVMRVGPPANVVGEDAYATYLHYLQQQFGHVIQIVPADSELAEQGRQHFADLARHRALGTRMAAQIAQIPIPTGVTGKTLYQALDAYAQRAVEQTASESGKVEAANAIRLRHALPDMDLSEFGYSALERLRDYWAARPEARRRDGTPSGRPISLTTVDNHLSTARRFVRWLDRSDQCQWQLPRHGLEALKVNLQRLRTDEELARQRRGVRVFSVDQLTILWKRATDFERLLVLLGLNAAMAQAENASLRRDEVESSPPTIKRIRRKSGVYGEFALWPETVAALNWWSQVRPSQADLLLMTDQGNPYTRQRISNLWSSLKRRIAQAEGSKPEWWLPFKHLRKTAAQLVRQASDGEVAGIFLSHGKPVASDELADAYSNRPFNRVAEALAKARQALKPMFDAAPEAFTKFVIGRGSSRVSIGE
jgi:integrase